MKQTPVYWEKNSMKQDKNGIYKKERNIQLNNLTDYILLLCMFNHTYNVN